MKIEKNNTTTYITAKKSIGCNAPIEVTDLALINTDFTVFNIIGSGHFINTTRYCIDNTKILAKLFVCKSRITQ